MSWRNIRTCSIPQREFLDALLNKGRYAENPVARPRVLYGGCGYAGKSHCLRSATVEINATFALAGFPNQWGALFCKRYVDLNDRHVVKLMGTEEPEWRELGEVRKSATRGLHFRFFDPALGGFYLRNAQDPNSGKGSEFPWVLIDELTEFERDEYDQICYMHRSSLGLPCLPLGAASNPDGVGHAFVKDFWVDRKFTGLEHLMAEGIMSEQEFRFVPARPQDNPTFGPAVEAQLRGFDDPMLVAARWEGSWELNMGSRFSRFTPAVHGFKWADLEEYGWFYSDEDPKAMFADRDLFKIYGSLDYGTDQKAASAFYLHALDVHGNVWTFHEEYMRGMWLDQQARVIRALLNRFPVQRIYCDPALKGKDSDGISRMDKFRREGIQMIPGKNDRKEGWATFDTMIAYEKGEDGRITVKPRWRIHEHCGALMRCLKTAPRDDRHPEDVSHKFREDHAIDSCRYFLHTHLGKAYQQKRPPEFGSLDWLRERSRMARPGKGYV